MARPLTLWPIQKKPALFSKVTITGDGGLVLKGDAGINIEGDGGLTIDGRSEGQEAVTLASGDGAISVKTGVVVITKGTAAALTLAAPTAGDDDGKILRIVAGTAAAHVITAAGGFNGAGTSGDVATFGGDVGDALQVVAYNGAWLTLSLNSVTIA